MYLSKRYLFSAIFSAIILFAVLFAFNAAQAGEFGAFKKPAHGPEKAEKSAAFASLKVSADLKQKASFFPDGTARVIIKLKNTNSTSGISNLSISALRGSVSAASASDNISDTSNTSDILNILNISDISDNSNNISKNAIQPHARSFRHNGGAGAVNADLGIMAAEISLRDLASIASGENVEYIQEDRPLHAFLSQSAPLIGADYVQKRAVDGLNITGKGISVCVIDTGADYTHPDFGGCSSETFLAGNCTKVISGYDYVSADNNPMDDNGHGTHVSGIIAANGSLKGIAPDAGIIAAKALDASGSGMESDVLAAIYDCALNAEEFNISVISMSLGGGYYESFCDSSEPLFKDAINFAVARNISVVAATGNDKKYAGIAYPACIQNAVRVTAVTKGGDNSDAYPDFANRGIGFPDILAAPGAGINSTYTNGGYAALDGTSMATPHVSGAIALLAQAYGSIYGGEGESRSGNSRKEQGYFAGILNSTGKRINDTLGAKIPFSRINVSAAYFLLASNASNPIAILMPQNGSYINRNFSQISASQRFLGQMQFSIDGGPNVSACDSCGGFTLAADNLSDGAHNATIYAISAEGGINYGNGLYSNSLNYSNTYFTIDTIPPQAAFGNLTAQNNSVFDRNWIFANLSVNETNFANATFFLFNFSAPANVPIDINAVAETNASALFINWTDLPGGIYLFNAAVFDKAGNSNSTESRIQTLDTEPPVIYNITILPVVPYAGANITIGFSARDFTNITTYANISFNGSVWALDLAANCSAACGKSNGEAAANAADYTAIFENASASEIYNLSISANDIFNRTSHASAPFYVRKTANITFRILPSPNISLSIGVGYGGSEIRSFESAGGPNGLNSSYIFAAENYTLTISDSLHRFKASLSGANFLRNETINISAEYESKASPNAARYRFTNSSFSIEPEVDFASAEICLNYSDYVSGFSNISRASVFKCGGQCISDNWTALATSLNAGTKLACASVSSFSAFALGETLPFCGDGNIGDGETCASCPEDAGTCPASPGGSDTNAAGSGSASGGGSISAAPLKKSISLSISDGAGAVRNAYSGASRVSVTFKTALRGASISHAKLSKIPAPAPKDAVYGYFEINKTGFNNSDIETAAIDFSVAKSWIALNDINASGVYLARYGGGYGGRYDGDNAWVALPTALANNTAEYLLYKAYSSGFSYFAISGKKKAEIGGVSGWGAAVQDFQNRNASKNEETEGNKETKKSAMTHGNELSAKTEETDRSGNTTLKQYFSELLYSLILYIFACIAILLCAAKLRFSR